MGPTCGDGKRVAALCVEFEDGLSRSEQMKTLEELKDIWDAHDNPKLVSVLLPHPGFPVDIRHNAKINREILAGPGGAKMNVLVTGGGGF